MLPACFRNHGNYVVSLGNVCRWLGQQAEGLGVEIFPGFAAAEVLYGEDGAVRGVATGDMGIGRDGKPTASLSAGHGAARPLHVLRGRLPRPSRQAAAGALQAARGRRPAGLRHRAEGAVGNQARAAPAGPRHPHRGLAARQRHLRRLVLLPPREQPGRDRLRRRARLQQSVSRARTRNSSATRRIPRSAPSSRAASASPTARAPSPPAGCSRCRSSSFPAAA